MSRESIASKLKSALDNLERLPAMPAIAHKLLALKLYTDEGEAQMIALIEQDPQLSAKILGLANAPAMGVGRKVIGIKDAAMLLGLNRLKSVAIGIATMSKFTDLPAVKNFDPQYLWSHSMTIAIAMEGLAREMPKMMRPDENQVFLAGLLHDIGLMALHHIDREASNELHHRLRLQPKRSMQDIEQEFLGMTHGFIGAQLVRHWFLPKEIIEVVGLHHSAHIAAVTRTNPLVRLVNLAEKLLPDFAISEHTNAAIDESEWRELGINPDRADGITALINELAMQVVQLPETHDVSKVVMQVEKPAPSGVEQYVAQRMGHVPDESPHVDDKSRLSTALVKLKKPFRWIGSKFHGSHRGG
jgi:putative nucleotidyltransferase with HDIG domain